MWKGRDILDILDFTREELDGLFRETMGFEEGRKEGSEALKNGLMSLAFFEPSTRTRMSFEAAMMRLGGKVMDLGEMKASSVTKGENLADTVKMLDFYSDVIVIRHWLEGASRFAADVCTHPVINAGEGMKNHPTQTMIDLYEIQREFGKIDGLTIAVVGDIRHARASASLLLGLSLFDVKKIYLIAPEPLRVRPEVKDRLNAAKVGFEERDSLLGVVENADVLYVTRVQKERYSDLGEYERVKNSYIINDGVVKKMKPDSIILHPLPRVDELGVTVDKYRQARYFEQARRGLHVRMAILESILGG